MTRLHRVLMLICLGGLFLLAQQAAMTVEQRNARFLQMSKDAEAAGLAQPFKGVTTSGTVQTGLFGIASTGVSTAPVRKAAETFLASLTSEQRAKTMFPVDDPEWRKWMNQHFYVRQGVSFKQMNDSQREAGIGLLRAALSAKGLKLSRDIMRLNQTLGELNNNDFEQYGEWLYYITVMGKPSEKEPWGFQVDGHHLIINYFVLGDQVVMTPLFVGSEPAIAHSGKYQGVAVLQVERTRGLTMIHSLDEDQRKKAVIRVSKTGNDNLGEAFKDNLVLDYAGIRADAFNPAQKALLIELVNEFVDNMDDGHARVKMAEVKAHLAETYFAWIGGDSIDSVFYYRVHSPVILIEFDHQQPANLRQVAANPNLPSLEHIHAVVRTPNGNDYGKDLLRQHYLMFPHSN